MPLPRASGTLGGVDDLEALVGVWLTLPEVAERLGTDVGKVRRLLQDRNLVGARIGTNPVMRVPAVFVSDGRVLPELRGTLTVLADAGFSDAEALRWLFTPDDTLPGTPVEAIRLGRKTEVRRRAQALAF